jgi:hypothetical protein
MGEGRDCTVHLADKEAESVTSLLYTTSKRLVEAQQHLFDTLWNKATTAGERIKDIEDGLKPGFTQIFEDTYEIQKKASEMISSAKQEILGIFSPTNTDSNLLLGLKEEHVEDNKENQEHEIQLLKVAAIRGLNIRIIAPDNNPIIKELKQRISREDPSWRNKTTVEVAVSC